MSESLTIRVSRGFDAQGVWAPLVVSLPLPDGAVPAKAATGAAPAGAAPIPVYLGAAEASPRADAPVLVACLKLMAVLVALGGAYLAGLFLLGLPSQASRPAKQVALQTARPALMPLVLSVGGHALESER